ncbi:MAG: thermonuclease family protein [Microthrixaceae bacterium]
MSRAARALLAATLVAAILGLAWSRNRGTPSPSGPGVAQVSAVADGDTIDVSLNGHSERVRLLGIDTPETVDPRKPVGCFGPEASHETKTLLPPGTWVRLERDEELRDRYGRLLAYVIRLPDELSINRHLLAHGFADTLRLGPNKAHLADFAAARNAAKADALGAWGACPHPFE